MAHLRLVLLGLLVSLVISAVGSASASAACGGVPPTNWSWCTAAGAEIVAGTFSGVGGSAVIKGTITGVAVKIECTSTAYVGEMEAKGKGKGTFEFKGCKIKEPNGCMLSKQDEKVLKANILAALTGELGVGKVKLQLKGAEAAEKWVVIEIEGCAIEGVFSLQGSQVCELPEAEVNNLEHEFLCRKIGSSLTLGVNAASLSNTSLAKLTGILAGLMWSMQLGT